MEIASLLASKVSNLRRSSSIDRKPEHTLSAVLGRPFSSGGYSAPSIRPSWGEGTPGQSFACAAPPSAFFNLASMTSRKSAICGGHFFDMANCDTTFVAHQEAVLVSLLWCGSNQKSLSAAALVVWLTPKKLSFPLFLAADVYQKKYVFYRRMTGVNCGKAQMLRTPQVVRANCAVE